VNGRGGPDLLDERPVSGPWSPDWFVRRRAIFSCMGECSRRCNDERHDNVPVDTIRVPDLLASRSVLAEPEIRYRSRS